MNSRIKKIIKYSNVNSIFIILSISFVLFVSCKSQKGLPPRIVRNNIEVKTGNIETSELRTFIRQNPNKKLFFFFPFHLRVYQFAETWNDNSEAKAARINRRIEKRREKNKTVDLAKFERKKQRTVRRWFMETLGEAPVLLDSSLMLTSANQMELHLNSQGHFNSNVDVNVQKLRRNRVEVNYFVNATEPYLINNLTFTINDLNIKNFEQNLKTTSIIKEGSQYNEDILDLERDRITDYLRDIGFYHFNKSFIVFTADSTIGNRKIDLNLIIRPFMVRSNELSNVLVEGKHPRSKINKVFFHTDFQIDGSNIPYLDTLQYKFALNKKNDSSTAFFIFEDKLTIRPKTLLSKNFINQADWVSISNIRKTSNYISTLNNFRYINIRFSESGTDSLGNILLNTHIELSPYKQFGYVTELEGTNSGPNLGLTGLVSFRSRNTFRGAEIFSIKLRGAVEAQKTLIETPRDDGRIIRSLPFNTIETGIETGLQVPSFIIPGSSRLFVNKYQIKSEFNSGLFYQQRPDYTRYISNLAYTWDWTVDNRKHFRVSPLFLNLVRINPDSAFLSRIEQFSRSLQSSYKDHLIGGGRISLTYSNQKSTKSRSSFLLRTSFETSGFLSRLSSRLFAEAQQGETYHIFGIRFSQYVRLETDFRYYYELFPKNILVFRTFGGLAVPYGNIDVMPFDKRFSIGGTNDMRAWKFRSLGPGTYSDTLSYDKTGDISLIGSFEYRFPIFRFLHSAVFLDAGNIWTLKEYEEFPGGKFDINTFYEQIALGAGMGIRLDFGFFVFRIDAGIPLHDPAKSIGKRWLSFNETKNRININYGIGYPF